MALGQIVLGDLVVFIRQYFNLTVWWVSIRAIPNDFVESVKLSSIFPWKQIGATKCQYFYKLSLSERADLIDLVHVSTEAN